MILGAAVVWLAFQAGLPPEVLSHVEAGMKARQEGRLEAAIAEFKKVTELAPGLAAAFVNLGAVYVESKDYKDAAPALERALELNDGLIGAHQLLGYALLAQGYAAKALPHLEKAGDKGALGIAELETGDYAKAVENLEAAAGERPNDPDLLYYLGRAAGLLSKQTFDHLIAAAPDSARAHEAIGENYTVLRRVPEAEREFRETLRLRPDTPGVHLALGALYAVAARWPEAEKEFRAEAELQPGNAEAAYRLGVALLEQGKMKEARAELGRADELQPGMPETLAAMGKAASLDGDAAGAEAAWKRLLRVETGSQLAAQAHFGLAGIYRKQGKTAEAEREMAAFRRLEGGAKR